MHTTIAHFSTDKARALEAHKRPHQIAMRPLRRWTDAALSPDVN